MRFRSCLLVGAFFIAYSHLTYAWDNHALATATALSSLPELAPSVMVSTESFDHFLNAEQVGLQKFLYDEEAWAKKNIQEYRQRPSSLAFQGGTEQALLHSSFLMALRVNPQVKLPLYLQKMPGEAIKEGSALSAENVSLLPETFKASQVRFVGLQEGELTSALDVVVTASDEPDYGLDIGLWEDNGTSFGKTYQLGTQPLGNPKLSYSSQAPFHMGFYHEYQIIYESAEYLKRTYPEMRIHLFLSLARYAFQKGHAYWGWRFAGWGLHYIQDLTQPYHSTVLPGINLLRMLFLSGLDLIGSSSPKNEMVQLVTNQHLVLENYEYLLLYRLMENHESSHRVMRALRNMAKDVGYPIYSDRYARATVAFESNRLAQRTDGVLKKSFPPLFVSDPNYLFGTTDPKVNALEAIEKLPKSSQTAIQTFLSDLMENLGAHSRNYVRGVVSQ